MSGGLPDGTVTFLFTDIEDARRWWEDAPTEMAAAVQVHDGVVRGTIERHGGYVFATRGDGFGANGFGADGFGAAFPTAADAAAAAIEAQRSLIEAAAPFGIRIGVHTGEAAVRDRIYVGFEVNRAARLMSLAHGGQVVVSDATEVLLRSHLRPLGEHRLPGLRGRFAVYQVSGGRSPVRVPRASQRGPRRRQPRSAAELVRRP